MGTKFQHILALDMITDAVPAGTPAVWVASDGLRVTTALSAPG